MSNTMMLQTTKFADLDNDGTEVEVTYGFRLFDDHESLYHNMLDSEDVIGKTNAELVDLAMRIPAFQQSLYEAEQLGIEFLVNNQPFDLKNHLGRSA